MYLREALIWPELLASFCSYWPLRPSLPRFHFRRNTMEGEGRGAAVVLRRGLRHRSVLERNSEVLRLTASDAR